LAWCSMFLAGFLFVFFPVGLKNMVNTGKFSVGASHFGPNFYMGNNPKAKGVYVPLAIGRGNIVSELEDIKNIAENALGRKLTPTEVSQYWTGKTLAYIKSDTMHWFRLLLKKWILVWNFVEVGDTVDIYGHANQSLLLKLLTHILHFGILFPLAIIGVCTTWQEREKLWPLYLMLFVYALGLTLFFVFARYRFPMVAIIILFSAAGILSIRNLLQKKPTKKIILAGSVIIVAAILSNYQIISEDISSATTYYNFGKTYEGSGERNKAVQYYKAALESVPNFPLAHNNLGIILINQGQYMKAINHFTQSVSQEPDFADTHSNLGAALSATGRVSEAIEHLKRALAIDPQNASVHNNLGIIYFENRQFDKALLHFREALRYESGNTTIAHNLQKVQNIIAKTSAPK